MSRFITPQSLARRMWTHSFMMVLFTLMCSYEASAHPLSQHVSGHQLRIWIAESEVTVEYRVDVPLDGATAMSDLDADPEVLLTGLVVEADGVSLALVRDRTTTQAISIRSRSAIVQVAGHAALPADTRTLRVSNGNLPDLPAFFSTDIQVSSGWRLVESTLVHEDPEGKWVDNTKTWRIGPENRTLEVIIAPERSRIPRAWQWFEERPPWRPAVEAVAVPAWRQWWLPNQPVVLALGAALSALLALAMALRVPRRAGRLADLILVALGGGVVSTLTLGPTAAVAGITVGLAVLLDMSGRLPWLAGRAHIGLVVLLAATAGGSRTGHAILAAALVGLVVGEAIRRWWALDLVWIGRFSLIIGGTAAFARGLGHWMS
jgi:hypothetical protein